MSKRAQRKRWHNNRQRLTPEALRDCVIRIRVNAKELDIIQSKADQMNMPLSTWAREALIARQLRISPVPEVNREMYRELGRIGINLNQITRAINQGSSQIFCEQFEKLEILLRKIKKALLGVGDDR